jgi:hypothetical protein
MRMRQLAECRFGMVSRQLDGRCGRRTAHSTKPNSHSAAPAKERVNGSAAEARVRGQNSPPKLGGVAAPSRKAAKPPLKAQTGWFRKRVFQYAVKEPPRRASRVSPPDSGGELHAISRPGYSFTRSKGGAYNQAPHRCNTPVNKNYHG